MAQRKNQTQIALDLYVSKQIKKAKLDWYKTINEVNNDLYKELIKMYDTFIDQFYLYKTKSYIRHGETQPGTGVGHNLYMGQNIHKINGNSLNKNPRLIVEFSGREMESSHYQNDSADHVLDLVMAGIRFPQLGDERIIPEYSWSGSYIGKYFSYTGTLSHAFSSFKRDFEAISSRMFYERWRKLGY